MHSKKCTGIFFHSKCPTPGLTLRISQMVKKNKKMAKHGGSEIPALCETEAGELLESRSSRPAWATYQAWWHVCVLSATQEAEYRLWAKCGLPPLFINKVL
uniref:Uncharacterized protein n=1 Tax=Theropithecus gelada TaxID=9565 RepID=A0A8D2JUK1_THEGE